MTDLRKAARGQPCEVRIPGVCTHDPETSCLAHLNGGGMGMKHSDLHAAIACSECHAALDRRAHTDLEYSYVLQCHYEGMVRTQQKWLREGYLSW